MAASFELDSPGGPRLLLLRRRWPSAMLDVDVDVGGGNGWGRPAGDFGDERVR